MSKKLQEFFQTKKLVLALSLAGAIAFFGGVYVSAQTEISTEPEVAQVLTPEDEEVTAPIDEPTITLVEQETPTNEETPVTDPVETPEIGNGAVTLEQAQVIAQAEHPEGTIVKNKTKTFDGQTVFKFYFSDGWKVYVKASDGQVIRVIDASDRDHDCQNKYKKNKEKADAVSAQARSGDNDHHSESRDWSRSSRGNSDSRWHR